MAVLLSHSEIIMNGHFSDTPSQLTNLLKNE